MFQFWTDFIANLLKKDDSSQVAAGRLKGAVFLDRLTLSPATLDLVRSEVVRAISRYLVIDENSMTLAVQAEGRTVALAASIPVLRPRAEVIEAPVAPPPSQPVTTAESRMEPRVLRVDPTASVLERSRARALRRKRQLKR